jgi:hypothetical protein
LHDDRRIHAGSGSGSIPLTSGSGSATLYYNKNILENYNKIADIKKESTSGLVTVVKLPKIM